MPGVIPHLIVAGAAEAIDFYKKAFGAMEVMRLPAPNGKLMHASLRIGTGMVMLVDEFPEMCGKGPLTLGGTPVTVHLYVKDVDAVLAAAVAAGAKTIMPATDMFWGDRYGLVVDPFGHQWSVASHIKDMSPEEMVAASRSACCGGN